jgi:hypothetical protein
MAMVEELLPLLPFPNQITIFNPLYLAIISFSGRKAPLEDVGLILYSLA